MNLEVLYGFISATALLAIFPGPDNIYVLTQSMVHGVRFGMATVLGLITGCLVHTTLLAFGASAIIAANDSLFFVLKLFGACYLTYLAYTVFRGSAALNLTNSPIKKSMPQLFKQGFMMNVLNPKVAIFFLAFFPGFLFSTQMNTITQFYILGGLFMLVSFLIFASIAFFAGSISSYLVKHRNAGHYLKWTQIIVFMGIAIYIVLSDK